MSLVPARAAPWVAWVRNGWMLWALIIASVLVVSGAIQMAGAPPGRTLIDLIQGSLGSASAISGTLGEVTPLLLSGLAVFLGLQAGLFNIGVEGQFTVGALAAALVGARISGPAGIGLALLAGIFGGGIWALPAAAIKAYRGGHEVITTIMLNSVAVLLSTALVAGPLKAPDEQSPQTAQILTASQLPNLVDIGRLQISSGLLIGLILAVGLGLWLGRSVAGYELRATGLSATAARFAGINDRLVLMKAMTWSGAFGGLAGAVQVLGFQYYFFPSLSSGYGFDALGVALLAGKSPLGLIPSALLFGILSKGGTSIQIHDQVPKGITTVILGLLIVIAAAIRYRKKESADE